MTHPNSRPVPESGFNQLTSDTSRKIKFDPTINLGHILTFLGFIFSIFVGWTVLDKRVTVLEEQRRLQAQVDSSQDNTATANMRQIFDTLTEIKVSVEKIRDRQQLNQQRN